MEQIPPDEPMTLQSMNVLLSTINSETENRIAAQNGKLWESLLGDRALLRSLGIESCISPISAATETLTGR